MTAGRWLSSCLYQISLSVSSASSRQVFLSHVPWGCLINEEYPANVAALWWCWLIPAESYCIVRLFPLTARPYLIIGPAEKQRGEMTSLAHFAVVTRQKLDYFYIVTHLKDFCFQLNVHEWFNINLHQLNRESTYAFLQNVVSPWEYVLWHIFSLNDICWFSGIFQYNLFISFSLNAWQVSQKDLVTIFNKGCTCTNVTRMELCLLF